MSTHVIGFRPPDEKWKKMKAVWDACQAADTPVPDEVDDFFDNEPPDEAGVQVRIEGSPAVEEFNADMQEGYTIDLTKLPEGLRYVRVYNSY